MGRATFVKSQHNPGEIQAHKIVIIEDNADHIELILQALQKVRPEYRLLSFYNGREALEYLNRVVQQSPFQDHLNVELILLDYNLPEFDGVEILKRLKSDLRLRNIPVVFLSSVDNQEEIDRAMAHGAEEFIVKPFAFCDLTRSIQKVTNLWCGS